MILPLNPSRPFDPRQAAAPSLPQGDQWDEGNRLVGSARVGPAFRVVATWEPTEADLRLHLTAPDGRRLPAAEVRQGDERSRRCVVADAEPGVYLVELSLPAKEPVPASGVRVEVEVVSNAHADGPQSHRRTFVLRRAGVKMRAARLGSFIPPFASP